MKTNIRLITPSFLLRDICGGDALPLHNVEKAADSMASDPTRTNTDEYIYQVKMFAAIVKSSLRDETAYIRRSPERDLGFLVNNYIKNISAIVDAYSRLRSRISFPSVPSAALEAYDIAGEFICSVTTNHICRLLKDLKSRDGLDNLADSLVELCHKVADYKNFPIYLPILNLCVAIQIAHTFTISNHLRRYLFVVVLLVAGIASFVAQSFAL